MNALPENLEYCPEGYHSALTRSVFVRLDGSSLRLSFPGKNIPKRAMFNEPRFDLQFVCQKHYSMMDASVELAPKSLSKGRLWNKRYPICLRIPCVKKPLSSSTCDLGTNDFDGTTIYLFSRTDRDKHMWFLRFLNSLNLKQKKPPSSLSLNSLSSSLPSDKERNSVDFTSLQFDESREDFVEICMNKQEKFEFYLSNLLNPLGGKKHASGKSADIPASGDLMWLNVFLGRLSFDFFMEEKWTLLVAERIQRKLNRLQLPFFLSELKVKEVHLGSTLPHLRKVSDPVVDEKGVWIYIDMSYDGPFLMTLETKLNLSKFQESSEEIWMPLADFSGLSKDDTEAKSSACSSDDESVDSLSESDCDSNVDTIKSAAMPERTSKSSRLMKFVDRLAQSSYIKSATKNKYVKRAMDDLSKKPLLLTVQVQWLTGTLALNIPPWPTDRLWYGFQKNTSLSITARPKLGQHVVRLSHVLEWIEKKLVSEFQKALVLPNMDDLIIPVMKSDLELD